MSITVSLAHLLSRGLRLQRYEALAIAQQLIGRGEGVPSVENVQLSSDGQASCISTRGTPAVSDVAHLLQDLLPPPEVPAPLRYTLARALGAVEGPPFDSLEAFSKALTRFEAGDRHGVVRALMQRIPRERPKSAAVIAAFPPRASAPPAEPPPVEHPVPTAAREAVPPVRPVSALPLVEAPGAQQIDGWVSPVPERAGVELPAAPEIERPVAPLSDSPRVEAAPAPRVEQPVAPVSAPHRENPTGPGPAIRLGAGTQEDAVPARRPVRQIAVMRPSAGERPATAIVTPLPPAAVPSRPETAESTAPGRAQGDPLSRRTAAGVIAASVVAGTLIGGAAGLWSRPAAPADPALASEQQAASAPNAQEASESAQSNPTDAPADQAVATGGNVPAIPDRASAPPDASAPKPVPELVRIASGGSQPAFSPAFAPDGRAMFFHTGGARDATSAIAMATAADDSPGDPRVVTVLNDGSRNYHPQPSPDGRLIAFDSDRDGDRGVYVANADGTGVRRITARGYAAAPTWSPDGKRLTFIRAERGRPQIWNLWVQAIDDGHARRVTSHSYGQTWSASWFPDNRRISYTHEDKLVVKDLVTGESRRFASPVRGRLLRTPAVSPDGKKVVFQVFRNGAWLLDLDTGKMRRILSDPAAEEFAWAPDGERIAYHSRRDGQWSIYVMAAAEWRGDTDGAS